MQRHSRSRFRSRVLGLAAAAAVSALALSGCAVGGGSGDAALSDEDVTISFNWWGAAARDERTRAAIELFEKKYPNITVKAQSTEWGGYWDKLATTVAGGDAPDVMQFDQLYLASYAQRGALANLGELDEFLDTSALTPEVLDQGKVKDELYGVPIGVGTVGLMVNRSIFEQYGIELPDATTWTWDELNDVALQVTAASGGAVHGLSPFGGDMPTLTLWARQHGNDVYDTDGKVILKPEVVQSYWEYALEQIESGAAPSASQLAEGTGAAIDLMDMSTGKVAMTFQPSSVLTAFQAAAPDHALDLLPFPTSEDASEGYQYLKPSMYWSVSSTSEHPAEAALLVNFLTTDTEVAKLFSTERGMPANPAFQEAIEPDLTAADRIVAGVVDAAREESGPAPAITPVGGGDSEKILGRYNQDIQFGKTTPKEAAAAFVDELTKAVNDAQ